MKSFVQIDNGEFSNPNMYNAWRGFGLLGYEVVKFDSGMIPRDITKETPVFSGVSTFQRILKNLKINKPQLESYPGILKKFLGRNTTVVQVDYIRKDIQKLGPVFVKPIDSDRKVFNGHVVKESADLRHTLFLPDFYPVLISEVKQFDVEYRVFVHKGKILDSRNYKGDFRKNIDYNVVEQAVQIFTDAPVAYCLDFGLTDQNETLLVEVTDATSFGCYGLDSTHYGKMLVDRWEELMK